MKNPSGEAFKSMAKVGARSDVVNYLKVFPPPDLMPGGHARCCPLVTVAKHLFQKILVPAVFIIAAKQQ